jgi:hypothetical protein
LYFEYTGRYARAEEMLFDALGTEVGAEVDYAEEMEEMLEQGAAFYSRLLGKADQKLEAGNLSRYEIQEGLTKLHQLAI